jgi:hypothetical protein
MLNVNGNTWGADIGTFLFANGNVNLRSLTFPLTSAIVAVGIVDGATLQQLETFAREFPKEFIDFTQALRHDVWSGLKHLSVSFEDVWLRITRPQEFINTSFAKLAASGEVALLFVINLHGRCDLPAVAASFQGISRSPDMLKSASAAFARVFTRHTTHRIFLRHAAVASGGELTRTDTLFFSTLLYVSTFTMVDSLCEDRTVAAARCEDPAETMIKITMDEIHDFLYPPPARIPVERYAATRTVVPTSASQRQQPSVSVAPVRGKKSFVSPDPASSAPAPASPVVVRRREAPWTATSYHNPATTEFAPQRMFCTPVSGPGARTSNRPSIAVTSPAPSNVSRASVNDSVMSDASNVHIVSKVVSTPVRRWAQRGAAAPEPSPSIRL